MSRARQTLEGFLPWAGLVLGVLALGIVHQFGSDATFDDCLAASPGPILLVGLLGLIVCAVSGFASWRTARRSDSDARRVVGAISAGSAALFIFAILLAMIATLVLPPCFA